MSENTSNEVVVTTTNEVDETAAVAPQFVTARGRGGKVNVRKGNFKDGKGFAVCVQQDGKGPQGDKGLIWGFFATRKAAQDGADRVNSGKVGGNVNARNAVVRPAYNLGSEPWAVVETPADDTAAETAAATA